jgi:serine/threonine-protein kinase
MDGSSFGRERAHDYGKTRDVVEVGQVISGKYKLLRLLGDGGMGSVYEAEHLGLGTRVAIKVLHADLARRAGIAERFLQEARVSAQIKSPNVVQVTDVDRTADGIAYLVMELLQGEPLSEIVRRDRKLPVPVACAYASQILQALEAAHSLGVIHRDLKPDNVFITFQGGQPILKLIDFGIAKLKTAQAGQTKNLTVAGMLMGTPEYMAPEQAYSADKVDVRADLYAVGVMLYEMLSGRAPASADDPRVLILKVERGEVTPLVQAAPGIQPEVAGFVHRAMAPRPELRFANATEMRLALEDIASGKRAGTARIPARPAGSDRPAAPSPPGPAAPAAPAAAPLPETTDGPRPEVGTGTVMGAPVDAALMSPAPGAMSVGPQMPTGTVGAAPLGARPLGGMAGPPPGAPFTPGTGPAPAYDPSRPTGRKGGSGLIIVLAVVAALLGAGTFVTYMSSTRTPPPVVPPLTLTTSTTPTATTPVTPPPNVPVTAATPLTPATVLPVSPQPGPPTPSKHDGGSPAHRDAGKESPPPADAGSGQTTIVTPFGTFQFPGPRPPPPFYPADQPWPPPTISPMPFPGQ